MKKTITDNVNMKTYYLEFTPMEFSTGDFLL